MASASGSINRRFSERWVQRHAAHRALAGEPLLAVTIAALSVTHFAETLLWALPISAPG